ncbi:hypothetical protein HYT51_02145 [Candidatus Woesearchaeota archaeon]|nr:hypothetical protein [Candidatus Woesearchaeota archaeon]
MKVSKRFLLGVGLLVILLSIFIIKRAGNGTEDGAYDNFAKCLTENGVKMYGSYRCSHCNNQKKEFGKSWQYIDYIECSLPNNAGQTQVCALAGINAYPTWEFSDGERIEGELSFEELAEKSRCLLEK